MERLTIQRVSGVTELANVPSNIDCIEICENRTENACLECPIANAFDRLAAYEDTGMTPEEVARLTAELAEANGLLDVGIQQLMQTMRERDQAVNMLERVTKDLIQLCEWLRTSPAIGEQPDEVDATAAFMAAGGIEA